MENEFPNTMTVQSSVEAEILERLGRIETYLKKLASDVNDIERDMKTKVPFIGQAFVPEPKLGVPGDDLGGLPPSMLKHAKAIADGDVAEPRDPWMVNNPPMDNAAVMDEDPTEPYHEGPPYAEDIT